MVNSKYMSTGKAYVNTSDFSTSVANDGTKVRNVRPIVSTSFLVVKGTRLQYFCLFGCWHIFVKNESPVETTVESDVLRSTAEVAKYLLNDCLNCWAESRTAAELLVLSWHYLLRCWLRFAGAGQDQSVLVIAAVQLRIEITRFQGTQEIR